jgi:hypothetical protein
VPPPLGSGWLWVARSHLSPDGGGLSRPAVHRLAADGYTWQPMATLGSRWLRFDPSGGFCCAIINLRHRLSKQPSAGFWTFACRSCPCPAFSGFDSHLRRPPHGCDLHRTAPISTEFFRVTAGKSSRPGPCRCSDSDRRLGPREAKPPAICPSGPSGVFSFSCGVGRANSIRLI